MSGIKYTGMKIQALIKRPYNPNIWRTVYETQDILLCSPMAELHRAIQECGYTQYRIITEMSDGSYQVNFTCELHHDPKKLTKGKYHDQPHTEG